MDTQISVTIRVKKKSAASNIIHLPGESVSCGYGNNLPQTMWLTGQKWSFSQSRRPAAQDGGVDRVDSFCGLPLAYRSHLLTPVSSLGLRSVSQSPLLTSTPGALNSSSP